MEISNLFLALTPFSPLFMNRNIGRASRVADELYMTFHFSFFYLAAPFYLIGPQPTH